MRLIRSEKAASEVMDHIIILGITILGVGMLSLYGVPAIFSLQNMADVKNAEQTFILFDTRASRSILGETPNHVTTLNLGGGSLSVEPNSTGSESYIEVGSENNTFNFKVPMGKIKYQLDNRIIAYEGGGLFSKYPKGTVMLSSPEFHFNGKTLTLPVINISSSPSVGGEGTATLSLKRTSHRILYPNTSCAGCTNYTNPVDYSITGRVNVNITSEFYDAWADYARTMGYVSVETNATSKKVLLKLTVYPMNLGENIDITDPIVIMGLNPGNPQSITNFSFKLRPAKDRFDWDIRAMAGTSSLIFHIYGDAKNANDKVSLSVAYREVGQAKAETWETVTDADRFITQPDGYVYIDMLSKSKYLRYKGLTVGSQNSRSCQPFGGDLTGTQNPDYSWGGVIRDDNANRDQTIYLVIQHYIQKMALAGEGDITFHQCTPSNNNRRPDSTSSMLLGYYAPGGFNFLHISENVASVSIS